MALLSSAFPSPVILHPYPVPRSVFQFVSAPIAQIPATFPQCSSRLPRRCVCVCVWVPFSYSTTQTGVSYFLLSASLLLGLPSARITGMHHHTPLMRLWDFIHVRQALYQQSSLSKPKHVLVQLTGLFWVVHDLMIELAEVKVSHGCIRHRNCKL